MASTQENNKIKHQIKALKTNNDNICNDHELKIKTTHDKLKKILIKHQIKALKTNN